MGKPPSVETADGANFTGKGNIVVDRPAYRTVFAPRWKTLPGIEAGPISLRAR